jgi:hypothetical protein
VLRCRRLDAPGGRAGGGRGAGGAERPPQTAPGEGRLERALTWVAERRQENPRRKLADLSDEAAEAFDLNPQEEDRLWTSLIQRSKKART